MTQHEQRKQTRLALLGLSAAVGILVTVGLIGYALEGGGSGRAPAAAPEPGIMARTGEVGVLRGLPLADDSGRARYAHVAPKLEDLEAYSRADAADDAWGRRELIGAGKVLPLSSGDVRARKLGSRGLGIVEVRIESGRHEGTRGFTFTESLTTE